MSMAESVDPVRRALPCDVAPMQPRVIMKMHIAIIATKKISGMIHQNAGHGAPSHQGLVSCTGEPCSSAKAKELGIKTIKKNKRSQHRRAPFMYYSTVAWSLGMPFFTACRSRYPRRLSYIFQYLIAELHSAP